MFNYIGVIGDIHLEEEFLQLTLDFFRTKKVDAILSVGDIADGKGDINRCCHLLNLEKVIVVKGNHDRWLLADDMRSLPNATSIQELTPKTLSLLHSFPTTYEFKTPDGLALLCHGLGKNDMAKVTPDDFGYAIEFNSDLQDLIARKKYRYIINGHTHNRMVRHFDNLTIINAGTLKQEHEPGFITIDFAARSVSFFEFIQNNAIETTDRISISLPTKK